MFPKTYILGAEYSSYTELRRVVNNQNEKTYILLKNRSGRYYVVQEQVSQNTNGNSPQNKYLYKVLNSTRDFSEAVYSFESNK